MALASATLLGGCADYGYGGYGQVGLGYGSGGYYDDYYGGGYGDPYYGGGYGNYGWFGGYYYPGSGYYVYDRGGRRQRWNDDQRRHWEGRRDARQDFRGDRRDFRRDRAGDRQGLRQGMAAPEALGAGRPADRQAFRANRQGDRQSFRAQRDAAGVAQGGSGASVSATPRAERRGGGGGGGNRGSRPR